MAELSIGEAIQEFLKKSYLNSSIQALQIEEIWEKLMGITIARYTDSIKIIGNRLIITTKVAPLKQELLYQKDKIRQRVNEALNQQVIQEVVIQ